MNLILASKSKRRQTLLKKLKINFEAIDSNLNESKIKQIEPSLYCQKLAIMKAEIIFKENLESTVIGADTIVCIDEKILEKPIDYDDAFRMLKLLSGNTHIVYTGVSILNKHKKINFVEQTKVNFFKLKDSEIQKYISNNNPYDKSGSYGIQDDSMTFVESIKGNYENVIGLPISKVYRHLLELKVIK
tara:strand:+ start:531 stop:1094 length:564 start_codon:yes stop_codon:yes gene_type:complete